MASLEQLETALRNADAAGDAAAAQALAGEIVKMRAAPQQPAPEQAPSIIDDVVKSGGIGVARGSVGLLGLPGDVGSMVGGATDWAAGALGVSPETTKQFKDQFRSVSSYLPQLRPFTQSGSGDITKQIESLTGDFYKPKTTAGEYAKTVGEFTPAMVGGPGSLARRAVTQTLIPAVTSETAGQVSKGTSAEPYARIAGAVGGAMLPGLAAKVISPNVIAAERQAFVDTLKKEGVPLTAGQRTGSKALQYAESELGNAPLSGGATTDVMTKQGEAFTAAALRRMGSESNRATPQAIDAAVKRIGGVFEDLSARNTLVPDQKFGTDIIKAAQDYVAKVIPTQRAAGKQNVEAIIQDVIGEMKQNGGVMPGTLYQATRSRLSDMAKGVRQSDGELAEAISGIRKALDGAMNRSISPADKAAWETARKQWGNWKILEKAITGAGSQAAEGIISPSQLRNAVATNNRGGYARGQGDFAELARAGEALMKPLPQSGTAPRAAANFLPAAIGSVLGGSISGGAGIPIGAIAGAAAPGMMGRALMSSPVQGYLGNQMAAPLANSLDTRNNMLLQLLLSGGRQGLSIP